MTRKPRNKVSRTKTVVIFFLLFLVLLIIGLFAEEKIKKVTHPLEYTEFVELYAQEYNMDAYLIYAVIKTESGFRPEAVSSAGARGLMQLMEVAFDWTKMRMGDTGDTDYDDIFDPQTNVKYGAYMLRLLLDELGDVEAAIAAYHAGLSQVQTWLGDTQYSSDGVTLDTIPTEDTAHYVSKVMKAYEVYCDLYQ